MQAVCMVGGNQAFYIKVWSSVNWFPGLVFPTQQAGSGSKNSSSEGSQEGFDTILQEKDWALVEFYLANPLLVRENMDSGTACMSLAFLYLMLVAFGPFLG